MIENYQEKMELEIPEPEDASFATIGAVYSDGVTLIFDGSEAESNKHYKVNSFVVFHAGDRVRIIKDSGTYVVEYPIGAPKTSFQADTATTANNSVTLNGKTESNLRVLYAASAGSTSNCETANNALKLNGKTENQLEVAKASSVGTADNVTKQINGKNISTIFEANGTTVKIASLSDLAGTVEDQTYPSNRYIEFKVTANGALWWRSSYYNLSVWYKVTSTTS